MKKRRISLFSAPPVEDAFLVAVRTPGQSDQSVSDCLGELWRLVETAGGRVVGREVYRLDRPDPAFFITRGKGQDLARKVEACRARTVIFDDDLSPAQARNLERLTGVRVIDRTQVILDIFAIHAHTKAGRLQIGLARLEYLLPRLRRMWTHLERQRGGIGVRGGPGEQQIEVDRRRIKVRISQLKKELRQVERHRDQLRRNRRRHGWTLVCLVGYTNAGKSTLLNTLTGSAVIVNDKLFATLDPVTRRLKLPVNQQVLITDTVGFIRKLPHQLVEAFHATLEEVLEADMLLHVVDASHHEAEAQVEAVNEVLHELGAGAHPVIGVLNKVDREGARQRARRLSKLFERAVPVSALTGEGVNNLVVEISDELRYQQVRVSVRIPTHRGDLIMLARSSGRVLAEDYDDGYVTLTANVPADVAGRLRKAEANGGGGR